MLICYDVRNVLTYVYTLYVLTIYLEPKSERLDDNFPVNVCPLSWKPALYLHLTNPLVSVHCQQIFEKMIVILGASWVAHSFKTLFGMESGPGALEAWIFRNSFSTPSSVILSSPILVSHSLPTDGIDDDESRVKTELNWFTKMSAFDLLSLSNWPLRFRGDTPIHVLSCCLAFTYLQNDKMV